MTNLQILNLGNLLGHFAEKKVPFSVILTKNTKRVEELIKTYNDERLEIINKYAILDENGNFIGKEKEDGSRIENPQTLSDIEIEDVNALNEALRQHDMKEIIFTPEKIDLSKTYFDSEMKEKRTVEDFVNTNIESSILNLMVECGLVEL